MRKEIIIKNYRLRIVDANVDLTEKDRRIMKLNKGTSIYVANSLIKPEIYRYSTKVTSIIEDVFPIMYGKQEPEPPVLSAMDMESLTYEDQLQQEQALFEKYGSKIDFGSSAGMQAIQEEEEQRQTEQREINQASEAVNQIPPMSAAQQKRDGTNKILIKQHDSTVSLAERTEGHNVQEYPDDPNIHAIAAVRRSQEAKGSQHERLMSSVQSYFSPVSRHTATTGNYEQEELRAVKQTEHLFEKWVRNVKTAYTAPVQNKQNPVNSFGVELPPPIKDINYKINQKEGRDVILKEKQLPIEKLTAVTLFSDRPYISLMLAVTNPEIRAFTHDFLHKTTKYVDHSAAQPSHFNSIIQEMNANAARRAIKFMREQYTHLDAPIVQDGNLHPDLFINDEYVQDLIQKLREKGKLDPKLASAASSMFKSTTTEEDPANKVTGMIDYTFRGTGKQRIPVDIVGYDEASSAFVLVNKEKNVHTMRPRIYIELEDDKGTELNGAMEQTILMRAESFQFLRVARLIQNELLKRYGHIELTEDTREKIYKKIGLDLNRNRRRTVMKVILQVEALYVYSILRSTLSSQRDDPFIKNMLLNFKIAMDSPALEVEKQRYMERKDLVGIEAFKMSAVKQDLDRNSGFLMNPNFIQLPGQNRKLAEDAVGDSKLFEAPFNVLDLVMNSGAKYKGYNIEQLKREVNEYPLDHTDWVEAQNQISKHFQSLIKEKWADVLAHSIWETLQRDFDFSISSEMSEDDLDPTIYKIFNQIKQFQQNMIYRAFENGLKDYLRFLIGFAYRNEDIRNSDIIYTIRHQRDINLVDERKNDVEGVPEGEETNDLTLIPRQWGPMVKLQFILQEFGKNPRQRKMKIVSQPDFEDIHADMFSVAKTMLQALKGIKRVESVVFPLLILKHEFLQHPDLKINKVLMNIYQMINQLLKECTTKHISKTRTHCQKYVESIFKKKTDQIILNLKQQSFQMANEGNDGDGDSQEEGEKKQNEGEDPTQQAQQVTEEAAPAVTQEDEEDMEDDSDSDDDGAGGQQQNMGAYKSVDIDQGLMREEILAIRKHKWTTMADIHDEYDFGLLILDCQPLKKDIIDHCDKLLNHLEKYIKNEFLDKMRNVKSEISQVKGRLDEKAESIDEVISLLEYIDTLKRTDNKVAEIQEYIDNMQRQMIFIDSVEIMFEDNQYMDFLEIRNWPRSFQKWIENRKEELQAQKDQLIRDMQNETNQVFQKILDFKLQIAEVLKKGLDKLTVEQREDRNKAIEDLMEGLGPNNTERPASGDSNPKKKKEKQSNLVQYEIPEFIAFDWLANNTGWTKKKFDANEIDKTFKKAEELKVTFEEVYMLTIQINKREALLSVPKTSFTELKKIQDDLKPLYELWAVASRFNNQIPQWLEGSFEAIESSDLETTVEEWLIELKRLQKTHLVENNKRQGELLQFMVETLNYFKKYFPMVRTLRSKGLALRHWRTIGQQIGFNIDPAQVQLFKLIALSLHKEDQLKIIKNISDIAQKEYAVSQALDNLDKEMKHVEFDFESAPDNETKLCKGIPDINSLFEEFSLRVNVLRTNPHMKNFHEKLIEIEKTVKSVVEILVDFTVLQRNWLYLNGIFSRSEINKQLANEVKQFTNLDIIFKHTMKGIAGAPQVFKISHRDNFSNQLKKLNQDADGIKQGLAVFLEQKRAYFPRLYFISNEELIDVFGRSDDIITNLIDGKPLAFLTNLFEGIEIVKVNQGTRKIYAMVSKSGEEVPLTEQVPTNGVSPEIWLKTLESVMISSLRHEIFFSYLEMDEDMPRVPDTTRDFNKFMATKASHERKVKGSALRRWLKVWPSQCTYLAQQIWFTKKLVSIFSSAIDRKVNVAKARKLKAQRMDSDDEMSDNSDEYASVQLSDDENANPTQQKTIIEQKNIAEANSEEEDEGAGGADGSGEEDENQVSTSNFNKTSGSIQVRKKKGEEEVEPRFEISLEDRIFRNRDRYLVNPSKHPGYQIDDVRKTVVQKTMILSTMLKKKLVPYVRSTVITFITILVYHRDYADSLRRMRIFKQTDFQWQLCMKFDLGGIERALEDVTAQGPNVDPFDANLQSQIYTKKIEVTFDVLQYGQEFGFEYLGNQQRLVITPLTERCQRSLLVALQYNYGGAPEGPFGTGKTETTKDLGRHLAKQCYVQNSTGQIEYENILRFFKGIASAGAWLVFDEFNRLDPKILAMLSQIIIQIQNSIRKKVSSVSFDDAKTPLTFTAAVFITLNPGYAGRTELPMDLKNLFRSVSMVVPDAVFITEILLFSSGFKNAQELSKRICSVQNLANVLMQQASVVKFDFGLRAIKGIIGIAEQLKQQVQNIWESDLPDIVNEDALDRCQWKSDQIIKDVQNEIDPTPDQFLDTEKDKGILLKKKQGVQHKGGPQTVNMSSAQSNLGTVNPTTSIDSAVFSQPITEEFSSIEELENSDQNDDSVLQQKDEARETGGLDQSEESDDGLGGEPEKQKKLKGPFFKEVFQMADSWQVRQTKVIMKQIGLRPNTKMSEVELEDYIIVKAVKDYNTSKFAHDMLSSINGIIEDVFLGSVPKLTKEGSNYSNLTELVFASFKEHNLDFNKNMNDKAFQLYEIVQVKQGCIILGETQSGKSTLSRILETALNKAMGNEMKLRMAQLRKDRLRDIAIQAFEEKKKEEENPKQGKKKKGGDDDDLDDGTKGKSRDKKKGKKNAAKSRNQMWAELYKKSKLSKEDIAILKEECVQRGVDAVRINPKSVAINELFGEVNKETYVWTEGTFTEVFRRYSLDKTATKKWIVLDGPVDHYWVENLNSILDENRKMNLPNGETINLSDGMCLLLETDNLSNVTPATISRCGLVFLSRAEVNKPKQIFNQYLGRLPPNLSESIKDIENQTNWLMTECLRIFDNEKHKGTLLLPGIDYHWVVQNYVKLLDTFFSGYWNDFVKQNTNAAEDGTPNPLLIKCGQAYGIRYEDVIPEDHDNIDPFAIMDYFRQMRLTATTGDNFQGVGKRSDARLAHNDFLNLESRQENSLKYLPIWAEAFVITSLAWTFAPVFTKEARKALSEAIKARILGAKSDFGTYQKQKKAQKTMAEVNAAKQQQQQQQHQAPQRVQSSENLHNEQNTDSPSRFQRKASVVDSQMMSHFGKNFKLIRQLTKRLGADGFQSKNENGFTTEFTEHGEKPLFISDFPFDQDLTVFDAYFNLDTNQWTRFDINRAVLRMTSNFQEQIPSMRIVQNLYVPTPDTIRYNYIMELLLTSQKPILVFGEGASGKSSFIKDMLFSQMLAFAQDYFIEHVTCSHYTNAQAFKNGIERNLVVKKRDLVDDKDEMGKTMNSVMREVAQDTGHLKPPGDEHKLIVYYEDLHMTWVDKYGDLPGLEVMRDLLQTKEWYSSARKSKRVIEATNLVACIDPQTQQYERVTQRLLFNFALIGMEGFSSETTIHIMKNLFEIQSQEWPSQIVALIPRLAKSIDELYNKVFDHLKPTPLKVHYAFNHRECFKFMTSFCKVEGNYLKTEANLCKLFYHECIRQYADKILMRHDYAWFKETLYQLIWDNFELKPFKELEVKTTQQDQEGAAGEGGDQNVEEFKEEKSNQNPATAQDSKKNLAGSQPTLAGAASGNEPAQTVPNTASLAEISRDPDQRVWPITDEDNLWFSIMNLDVDGYYCEFRPPPESKNDESIEQLIHNKIESYLQKYNESADKQRISLTLYKEFNRHLMKIVRAINIHDGHVIIVGMKGYGISMLTKLACFASGIQHNKMELHPNFIDEEWRSDMRKNIIYSAMEDKSLAYVCDEYRITNDQWYHDLETLVKSNVCSEITRQSDILQALVMISQQQNKSAKALVGQKQGEKEEDKEEVIDELAYMKRQKELVRKDSAVRNRLYDAFLKRVRKNFHLIFNFTPSGSNFREKMDNHKQLMINSQMIWIQNLCLSDLEQVGQKIFVEKYNEEIDKRPKEDKNMPDGEFQYIIEREKALNPKILKAVSLMYLATNDMAKKYVEEFKHTLYFTPVFFIRTFRTFTRLLDERKKNVIEIQKRYNKGLKRLKKCMRNVKVYSTELRSKTPVLQARQEAVVNALVEVEESYNKLNIQAEKLRREEFECQQAVAEAESLQDEAQDALNKIVPCVEEAIASMSQISKYQIGDVKTLDRPPRTIKLVMKAICILLEVEPVVKRNSKGEYKPSYWKAAIGPEVLGNPRLPEILVSYNRDALTEEMMARVEDILGEADYSYENAHKAFKNATGLFKWVRAIRDYFYIFQEMEPRRNALTLAEKQSNMRKEDLKKKVREIEDLSKMMEGLKVQQEDKKSTISELEAEIASTILKKRRADTLLKGLNAEQQKWVVCTRMLNSKYETVQGDVLLAAGYITMAGGFTQKYRLDLVTEWQKCINQAELSCSEIFGFQELFGDNFKIREWHANQLPPDTFSTDNGLILEKTRRYRMIIDPQQLAWNWIRRQYASAGMIATKMHDPGFKRTLEIAIDLGKIVLIENLGEKVDVHIESLVRREITKYGNQKMIKFCRRPLKYDENFDLFILTNLSKPHYDCNITNHVCQVNFFVTVEGLTQNLLSMIVANERPDLEESFNENSKATFENVKLLKETENKILNNLTTPDPEILLKTDKLIEVLKESKVCAETVAEKLKKINNTNQFLQKTRLMYAPVAVRAANLYFAVTELYQVNSMYQFSMKWFFNVFNQTLQKANALLKANEITIDDEDFKLLNHKFSADDRINMLIKSFTQELIRKTIFSCFQDDRQLVTYFICIKVLLAEELLDSELMAFCMTGSKKISQNLRSPGAEIGIPWMNDVIWAELDALSNVRPFTKENTLDSIRDIPVVWNQLFDLKHINFTDFPNRNLIDIGGFFDRRDDQPAGGAVPTTSKKSQYAYESKPPSQKKDIEIVEPQTAKKPQSKQQLSHSKMIKEEAKSAGLRNKDSTLVKSEANIGKIMDQKDLQSVTESSHKQQTLNEKSGDEGEEDDENLDRKTRSRATTINQAGVAPHDPDKIWTTEEILADEDLWRVTDSSEDESSDDAKEEKKDSATVHLNSASSGAKQNPDLALAAKADGQEPNDNNNQVKLPKPAPVKSADNSESSPNKAIKATPYNPYDRNKDYYENEAKLDDELEQMARYLVDKAPQQDSFGKHDRFTDMQRKTKTERKTIITREFILKCQCELAMQRCIRPDLMQQALHKIVGTIYDFNYMSFELDILAAFIDPDGTLAWRRHKMAQGLSTGRHDGTKNNAQQYSPPARKSTENNIQLLIKEAYEESTATSPIFFLVTHSINVFNELQLFYQKKIASTHQQTKMQHFQVGKGLNKTIEDAIEKAQSAGDWILIENIHLADEWIDTLELIIAKLGQEVQQNSKFRIFLSAVQMDNCPHMILKQSVKVALQQPTGVKLRMERHIEEFANDTTWRRGPNYVMHKNMYFCLAYLHSVLDGRKLYGPLGWNIYSGFDASDFHISNSQIVSYLGESVKDKETQVHMIKYLFANVNFSGKISREEDLRKLNAVIEDLINIDLATAVRTLSDPNRGHYGIPRYDEDMIEWVEKNMPKQDPCELYGFNRNSERYVLKVRSFDIMRRMYHLNRTGVIDKALGYQDIQLDLENQSIRISLAKSSLHTQSAQHAILANIGDNWPGLYRDDSLEGVSGNFSSKATIKKLQKSQHQASQYFNQEMVEENSADALLPLFVRIQKLLMHSSLDSDIKNDSDRFNERVDGRELPMRDEYDKKVSACAMQMRSVLSNMLSERTVSLKLPFKKERAVHNVFAIEIRQYIALLNAIQKDVVHLMAHIDGKYMKPLEIEKLWSQIQRNLTPTTWRKYAFQTAYVSLADFIIELVDRVKFWQYLLRVNCDVPAIWVPAFFDPSQYLNALRQKLSREKDIPARKIKNVFEVTEYVTPTKENCPVIPNVGYIYGLWLEGAAWDREQNLLVEQTSSQIYDKFPIIKVTTMLMTQKEMDALDGTLDDFEDNPPLSKKDVKAKEIEDEKIKEQMDREDKLRSQLRNEGSKSKIAQEKKEADMRASRQGSALGRMNSRQSLRESRDSQYNFKRPESRADDDNPKLSRQNSIMSKASNQSKSSNRSRMSKVSKTSKMSKQSNIVGGGSTTKVGKTPLKKDQASNASKLGKMVEFAEDSAEDYESSDKSSDEEEKKRKWAENLYYYNCPVFRTTLRLRTGEISSDNKPVFYIKLQSLTHPRKWVKRSVALLMETYR